VSTAVPPRPEVVGHQRQFTIVASQFNPEFVQGLVNHATEELRSISKPNASKWGIFFDR
jgi:6,7-dimethyl-8-ribityllumazine synthase